MFRICAALLVFVLPFQVWAGAWPREQGSTFLSFNTVVTSPLDDFGNDLAGSSAVYLERGMRNDLTFGIDALMTSGNDYSAIAFLRRPVARSLDRHRIAVLAGAGVKVSGDDSDLILRLGAAWGRGITLGPVDGWAALDATADYLGDQGDIAVKADFTLGLKPTERLKLMVQLQAGDYPGSDPYLRVSPSLALQIDEKRHLELGFQVGLKNDDRAGLKLGTWLEF